MGKLNYIVGDATEPIGKIYETKIIVHVCNDIGAWGSGFVMALSNKWDEPEQVYRKIGKENLRLGDVSYANVDDCIFVANMVAQRSIKDRSVNLPPIRYEALKKCLINVNEYASALGATIHMPRIGCGLAGGNWKNVLEIIESVVDCDVYVYDLIK